MLSFYRKYYLIFQCLSLSKFPDKNYGVGLIGYSRHAMLNAFVLNISNRLSPFPGLLNFSILAPYLPICEALKWVHFLTKTSFIDSSNKKPTSIFENTPTSVNRQLIAKGIVSLDALYDRLKTRYGCNQRKQLQESPTQYS